MLKRIVIENYRSCLKTSIDLHPNLSVLIGPNGSGKTNILQALMLLNKMAREFEDFRLRAGHPGPQPITVSSSIEAEFQNRLERTQLNASLEAYTDSSNNDIVVDSLQRWSVDRRDRKRVSVRLPIWMAKEGIESLSRYYLLAMHRRRYSRSRNRKTSADLPIWAKRNLIGIARFCGGITYYGASQFTNPSSCPVSFEIEEEGQRRRLHRLRGHARVLYDMYSAKRDPNSRYGEFIDIVGPKGLRLIDDLKFRPVQTSSTNYSVRVGGKLEIRTRHNILIIPQFRIGKQRLSSNQLSEGTFKTLALLFHVITDHGTVLLIEEPEVCVHHGLLSSILEIIKSFSEHKQMILSTHSDYVLDHVKPENVYRVLFDRSEGTIVRHIPNAMDPKQYNALRDYLEHEGNLGDYWREGGLGDRP